MRLPEEPDTPFNINIVPAIDVIFAILVYFIVSSLFLTRSEGLPVNLPQATSAQPQQTQRLTVSIDRDGNLALDRDPIEIDLLQASIRNRITAVDSSNANAVVIINADEAVNHGTVIAVMDELRQISSVRLAIATQPPR
ncbi:MAG: biopolymer transporter ExbD [Cyanobacteria bacterium J06641_5]